MTNAKLTFDEVEKAMAVADRSLPHDAYWLQVHAILDTPYGEVFTVLAEEQQRLPLQSSNTEDRTRPLSAVLKHA